MGDDADESLLVGVVLATLFPEGGQPLDDLAHAQARVSSGWQVLGARAQVAEPHGVLAGMEPGYMSELLGRAAAAGEQLGLAFAALRDAESWVSFFEYEPAHRRVISGRAMAEASGLWAVGVGHAVTNVVARVVRAHPSATHLDKIFGWNGPPSPFQHSANSNLSFNRESVKGLGRAARETGEPAIEALVEPLTSLMRDQSWVAFRLRRDVGFHRWRPQSIPGGASTTTPWLYDGTIGSLGIGRTSGHVPPSLEELVAEARSGYDALSEAMGSLLDALPAAMRGAGINMWRVE